MKQLIDLIKRIVDALKEENKNLKYKAQLAQMPLCIEAFQGMVNVVEKNNVAIEIRQKEGNVIIIKKEETNKPKSFKDKFNALH